MALNYVTLTVDLYDGGGNLPSQGLAIFTPSAQLTDSTDSEVIDQSAQIATFNGTTSPTVKLLATDNAGPQPSGWGWTVSFSGVPGNPTGFSFFLPFSGGASQHLSKQAPVMTVAQMQAYMPLPTGTATSGYVPIATGSGSASAWGAQSGGGGGVPVLTFSYGSTGAVPTSGTYTVGQVAVDQKHITRVCTVAGSPGTWTRAGFPSNWFFITDYGAVGDGTTDNTTAITNTKTAAGAKSRNTIVVEPGTYLHGPETFDGFHWKGYGAKVSILKAKSGSLDWWTNTGYINGSVPTDGSETETLIEDLGFDGSNLSGTNAGNLYAQAGVSGTGGVGSPCVIAVGNGAPSGTFGSGIPTFDFRNCDVYAGPGINMSTAFSRGGLPSTQTHNVFIYNGGGHGLHVGSDQIHVGPVSENSSGAQFYANGSTSYTVVGAKAYSGLTAAGYGYHLQGQTSGASWVNCLAQDNSAGGVFFDSAQGYILSGFCADSNTNTGAIFTNSTNNRLDYNAIDRYYNSVNKQTSALSMDAASTGNIIDCSAFYRTGGSATMTFFSSGNGAGNRITLPGANGIQTMVGGQSFAVRKVTAAYTVTPTDFLIEGDASVTGGFVITLPTTGVTPGQMYICKKVDGGSNEIDVTPATGTIDGRSAVALTIFNDLAIVMWDGTTWQVIGGYLFTGGIQTTRTILDDGNGNVQLFHAGSGLLLTEGANCKMGVATLSAGSVVVANTAVTANSRILLSHVAPGGTLGHLTYTVTAGTSFTITSTSGTDTSTVLYVIIEHA